MLRIKPEVTSVCEDHLLCPARPSGDAIGSSCPASGNSLLLISAALRDARRKWEGQLGTVVKPWGDADISLWACAGECPGSPVPAAGFLPEVLWDTAPLFAILSHRITEWLRLEGTSGDPI